MQRSAWKNRVTLTLGVGLATVALIAGCTDDNGDDDDLGIDTTPVVTTTTEVPTTEATTEATPTTDATETATATEDATTEPEDVTVNITADGLMMDGAAASTISLTAGSTVTFTNDGAEAVALTTDDDAIDEEIDGGDSYEHTFDEAGVWAVSVDGVEAATITVTE